jgi:hypothetical protein
MPLVHGSSLFERGNTQALATCTIGSLSEAQKLDAPVGPKVGGAGCPPVDPSFTTGCPHIDSRLTLGRPRDDHRLTPG